MGNMIKEIEKLRVLHKVRKSELCQTCGVNAKMYGYYLKNGSIPIDHAKKMIKYMGYDLAIITIV